MWVGINQSVEGLIELNGGGRATLLSARGGTYIFSCPQTLMLLVLWPLDLDRDLDQGPWVLRPPGLGWNYTTGFPGPLACKQ